MTLRIQLHDRLSGQWLAEWSGEFVDGGAVCTVGTSADCDIVLPRAGYPDLGRRAFRVLARAPSTFRFEHMGLPGQCSVDGARSDARDLAPGRHDVDVSGCAFTLTIHAD